LDRPDASLLLDDVRKQALEQRPDLLALRKDMDRAAAEWKLQMANAKQDWTVEADYRRQQFNAKANAVTVTVGVPLPVFDRNQGEIQRALQEQRQAGLRLQALESQVAAEVEDAYSQFQTARSLLHTVQGAMLQHARDVRQITEFAYRRGDTSLLALLDAQRAFNETMQAYIATRAEYARSLYLLAAASGKEPLP
jgi:cobalt-zinc-cadmium efflux system outer membrane protein